MKLHFSIPAAEELREGRGGRYVLYSLFLEGFLLGKARYCQLRCWDEQLRQVFGSAVPAFPPKFYLAMTQSMADERRSQLEQYLQNVTLDVNITKSDVFINFFRKLQLALLVRGGDSRSGCVQDLFDLQLCACLLRQVLIVLPKAVSYLADFKAIYIPECNPRARSISVLDIRGLMQYIRDAAGSAASHYAFLKNIETSFLGLELVITSSSLCCWDMSVFVFDFILSSALQTALFPPFVFIHIPKGILKPVSLLLQQGTFKIQTQRAFLDVYLADGSNITLEIQTSDTAERILQVTSCKMGLARELIKYFTLFFIQDRDDEALSVVKKVAEFELPYVSLQSMKELDCKLGIRKWYMDPALDTLLTDCKASMNLLYMQAIQEVKRNWIKPTEGQRQELEFLQKNTNKVKFLEKIREVQFYGYVRLDPCICDYPEVGCSAEIYAGNNEINCCIKLPTNQTKEGEDNTLEFRFEYNDSGTWQWIILYTKQAFLLSSCLKKMISEQMIKETNKGPEMETEMLESMKNSKKSSIQQKQVVHSSFISRKRFLVRPNKEDCVFEKIREEDL